MEQWYNYVLFVTSNVYLLVDTKELPELHAGEVEMDFLWRWIQMLTGAQDCIEAYIFCCQRMVGIKLSWTAMMLHDFAWTQHTHTNSTKDYNLQIPVVQIWQQERTMWTSTMYTSLLQTTSYLFEETETTPRTCVGVVKPHIVYEKSPCQHMTDLNM